MVIQRVYEINPEVGFVGDLARPSEPHSLESGLLHVPTGAARNPRPGDAVYYDTTANGFAVPTDAAERLLVVGILHYRRDAVAAGSVISFADDTEVEIGVFGTFWVEAGAAAEYGQILQWQLDDQKWDPLARVADIASMAQTPIVCVSRSAGADGDIIQARIGFGRVI